MSDIYKEIRHLRASLIRQKLTELGIDYNAEGASSKEELRKLLVKAMVSFMNKSINQLDCNAINRS
jgi:hypothetical protein